MGGNVIAAQVVRRLAVLFLVMMTISACRQDNPAVAPPGTFPTQTQSPAAGDTSPAPEECADQSAEIFLRLGMADSRFVPSCLIGRGTQGLALKNSGAALHNFSVEGTGIDVDVPPGEETNTEATGLGAGEHTFFCKYHRSTGMQGKLQIR